MVTIFFLISGYVLSHKSLRLMRSREFAAILDTLASSVFRRGIRLFLPIIASSFLSLLFELARLYPRNPWPPLTLPGHETSWIAQICDWFLNVLEILNPFQNINVGDPHPPPYDAHLWTIPVEFRGSIVIFLVLLALAKARNGIRLLIVGMLVFYVLWIGHWEMGLFLGGTFLADLQFLRRDLFPPRPSGLLDFPGSPTPHPFSPKSSILHHHKILLHLLTVPLFLLGLFLVSFPDLNSESTPGYIHIHAWTPLEYRTFYLTQKFWDTIGALILLTAISFSPPVGSSDDGTPLLQMPFNTRLAQYLGDISFSLYLVHGPMIYGFGWAMLQDSKQQSPEIYWWGFVKCFAVVGGLSLWGADLFMRFIDVPSVGFGKWLADKGWVNE
jgi:peptidoglycan/LPS O-acetylase OafA/YrhL